MAKRSSRPRPDPAGAALALALAVGVGCTSDAERCAADPKDREACEKACEAGDADGCHRLARILDELVHLDPALAEAALDRSCELGSASGCIKRRGYCAASTDDGDSLSDAEKACRASYTQKACDLGDDLACRQLRLAEDKQREEAERKAKERAR